MKAVVLTKHGPPEVLRPTEVADVAAGPHQVRVRIDAVGLNYAEILSRKGLYGWTPEMPYILGMEATGVVDQVGEDVCDWSIGDAVSVGMQSGAYAEQVVVSAEQLLPALPHFSLEENAAFGVNYMTAWVALMEMARARSSDRVIVTAAAGGVGTAALQIADRLGCEVIGLAGSDAKLELARSLGADLTVRYGDVDFPHRLRAAVGDAGVDVVLETVGGDVFKACDAVVAPFGRIVVAGYAGLDYRLWNPLSWWRAWRGAPRMGLASMYKGSKGLLSTHLGYLMPNPDKMREVWDALVAFVREHEIRPHVGHTLTLDEVAEAHRLMESRASTGKIVLRV